MFAYISKINNTDIIDYTHNIIRLYYNVDDNTDDDEYLFNTQTIAKWGNPAKDSPDDDIVIREDIPLNYIFISSI
jgi:hypothetical protein